MTLGVGAGAGAGAGGGGGVCWGSRGTLMEVFSFCFSGATCCGSRGTLMDVLRYPLADELLLVSVF